ncbi:MAG: radical SAM protein [Gaiellaceae bacterium]
MTSDSDRFLAPTSQFYFCSLPLRLDSYAGCGFGCSYCFAAVRGGSSGSQRGSIEPDQLLRRLRRLEHAEPRSVVDEFLAQRQPLHLGGMSDPFMPQERDQQVTLRILEILAKYDYPTVISTKGDLYGSLPYLDVLRAGNFFVQASLSTLDDELAGQIERGAPSPSARLRALETARHNGVPTSVRHQPVLPNREQEIELVIGAAASAGALHYAAEFLKLGVEQSPRQALLVDALPGVDGFHRSAGNRVGREWILPVGRRLPWLHEARSIAHSTGLSFGAADTDLLPMSDGEVCCSGADLHLHDPGRSFKRNYLAAVRSAQYGIVEPTTIQGEWTPQRSLARFVNSRSRIVGTRGAVMADYLERNWNGRNNGPSPGMFHGVESTGEYDSDGFRTYVVAPWLREIVNSRWKRRR